MAKKSAGILLFRKNGGQLSVLLVHPGGPFWKNKDAGAWSVPKGEIMEDEDPLERARTEFSEETGQEITGNYIPLAAVTQKGGKKVYCWAVEGNLEASKLSSNTIQIQWPPRSGKMMEIPEVDRWEWFSPEEARIKINPAQVAFIDELEELMNKS
ncbi:MULTISPECIES: NUDIX hydrolase [Chryseobacterium]|uniref:NUDIX family NTP pyrophosphohydrolase n=1 Tax=Chryseobacterium camelliae TaxID=1265445 RepID=A0ABU0TFK3_9FLAO|nr:MULTISPECIES: NUDIX domain-containing protein [Chryseobacterium]MDT3406368.1 putative NUDIX family NTP pyrophosphohydrolase [Pseudacidovorax intermedius]MDQ1095834.1 putative NUDIX family NTP pyrophosphohydrolase [Chryseobacterium camelliae]MDQ1099770.1 putative NUDIX family NTP pyrophosphohydrolase [Chryseobacterium sp. SORGH_AS_1048]MDR6087117.1 putative NUDIX family NTP pyrophosphohydrolase [Chryseobacterium sp. SORGH_AS_0909]MDR6131490.1 putative NUDIX family NTP pyrophosphohydrolase [C